MRASWSWWSALSVTIAMTMVAGSALTAAEDTEPDLDPPVPGAEAYDPRAGVREDGGIPPAAVPEVAHPQRWRYFPPGRIPPGNLFQRFFITSFIVPQVEYEEATGLDLGVGIFDADFRHQRRQEFLGATASYSTEGQQEYAVKWRRKLAHYDLDNGGAYFEERSVVEVAARYEKTLTARFFGLGADTAEGDETSYTDEATVVGAGLQHGFPHAGDPVTARVGLRYEHHNLSGGEIDDVPSTDAVFPDRFRAGDGHDSWWLTLGLQYDQRDSDHQPYRGWDVDLDLAIALDQTDGDPAMIARLEGTWSQPIPSLFHSGGTGAEINPPTDTIAVGAFVESTAGDLPFYLLPNLGGARTLRGYIADRFVAEHVWHASVEWRTWFLPRGIRFTDAVRVERVGLAVFTDMGSASGELDELLDADLKITYGLGIRWAFERTAVFRTDYALSEDGGQFIASFGLTF